MNHATPATSSPWPRIIAAMDSTLLGWRGSSGSGTIAPSVNEAAIVPEPDEPRHPSNVESMAAMIRGHGLDVAGVAWFIWLGDNCRLVYGRRPGVGLKLYSL